MMLNGNSYPWLNCHRLVAVLECHQTGSTSGHSVLHPITIRKRVVQCKVQMSQTKLFHLVLNTKSLLGVFFCKHVTNQENFTTSKSCQTSLKFMESRSALTCGSCGNKGMCKLSVILDLQVTCIFQTNAYRHACENT